MAWKRASMAAALGYHTGGSKARLCFHMQADSYDTDSLIGVLQRLAGFYRGQRWCCCGTGCRHTGAAACVPTWTPSSSGSSAAPPHVKGARCRSHRSATACGRP